MSSHKTLLLGESASGKTHLAGQILGRLRSRKGRLLLRNQPARLQMLEEVLDRLAEGRSAAHTPAGFYGEIVFDLEDELGNTIQLAWPDYAGEQVSDIVAKRALRPEWANRVLNTDRWVLLIRLSGVVNRKTALFTPRGQVGENDDKVPTSGRMPEQMRLIELLQVLSHIRGAEGKYVPPLDILLTCADELDGIKVPEETLNRHMPMFTAFVRSNWVEAMWSCWAMSALGRPLDNSTRDEEFADEGAENQGYVITPTGERLSDLTLPFAVTLETV